MIDELELCKLYDEAKDLDLSFLANDYDNVHFILCINPASFGSDDYEIQQKVPIKAKKSKIITIQVHLNEEKQHFQDLHQQHRNSKKILDFLRYVQTKKADVCGYHSSSADDNGDGLPPDFYPNHGVIWVEQNAEFSFKNVLEKVKNIIENKENGEFVKKNNVKRQQEYEKLILFQCKDGN